MNNLEKANFWMRKGQRTNGEEMRPSEHDIEQAKAHALIAIAESLARIVEGIEMPRMIVQLPKDE